VNHILYIHHDARRAHGLSTWVALAKAIGRDDAHAILEAAPPLVWGRPPAPPAGVSGTVRRRAILHGRDSQPIGTFYELT
jgi:hypothetical protein